MRDILDGANLATRDWESAFHKDETGDLERYLKEAVEALQKAIREASGGDECNF